LGLRRLLDWDFDDDVSWLTNDFGFESFFWIGSVAHGTAVRDTRNESRFRVARPSRDLHESIAIDNAV
jgi:hypothetical protein